MLTIDRCASSRSVSAQHRQASADSEAVLRRRLEAEYREMPGLCLTFEQACRLFGLPEATCACLVRDLIEAGILRRTPRGHFVRA